MGSVRLQHGRIMSTPIFRPSDFPHNVPPLQHFQREQLSSFILLFWRVFLHGAGRILEEQLVKQEGAAAQ